MVVNQLENDTASNQGTPPMENSSATEKNVCDLIDQLEDYVPTVPDALTAYYLNMAGFEDADERIIRVISVTAQKFIADIANDALQHCKSRSNSQHSGTHSANKDKKSLKDRKYSLAIEDLASALADHGITMRKPQYFV